MSFISKDHFSMALKGVRKLIDQISQSDWNETDETSKAYIQNKPFEEIEFEYTFVDLENAPTSGQAAATLNAECEYELIPGVIYKVTIDGIEREIECTKFDDYPDRRFLMLDSDSSQYNKVIFQSTYRTSLIQSFTPHNWKSVKVIGKTRGVKQLDEKFIPDTIARKEYINKIAGKVFIGSCTTSTSTSRKVVSLDGAGNNFTPFFSLEDGVVVCVNFYNANKATSLTLNVDSTGDKPIKLNSESSISSYLWGPNSWITFVYNNSSWNIVSISPTIASTSHYGITTLSNSVSSTSGSQAATSSAVKTAYDLANKALPKSGGTLTGNLTLKGDPTSNLHAATKQYVDNVSKVDWNQNDPDAKGYVENKPFYDCRGMDEIVEEHHGVVFIERSGKYIADDIQIGYPNIFSGHDGSKFKVVLGDREFLATMQEGNLGNRSLYLSDYPDTGETFCINGSITNFDVYSTEPINGDTVMIYRYYGGLKQLDEKFIPDTIARISDIPTDEHITNLINNALEGIENGTY